MKLPDENLIEKEEYKRLYEWDVKEYFTTDKKNYWAIFYRNRMEKIVNSIERFVLKGKSVLDIGCAQATVSILLAEKGYKVIASDLNFESLQYATLRYEFGDCSFIALNAEKLPFKMMFDVIILGEFLEHVSHPDKILKYYKNHLNDDGIIIVTTPNGYAPHNWRFQSYTKLNNRGDIDLKQFGPEREDHVFNFGFEELKNLLLDCGYDLLISEYLNSYFINPINIHKFLPFPYSMVQKINICGSKIPFLKKYLSMGLFFVARKCKES